MSKVFSGLGAKIFGHGPGAPAPLPADDSAAKAQAQSDAARAAIIDRASAGRRGTESAGREIAFDEQQGLMAKKLKRVGASTDLIG